MKFKKYCLLYTKLCRSSKKEYYCNKFIEFSNNGKKTWQTINKVLGRTYNKISIPNTFISNDKILTGEFEIAEGFNSFFANIGPKLAKDIPQTNSSFADFLSGEVLECFTFQNVTPLVLKSALSKMNPKNSCGQDNISSNLLKYIIDTLSTPLCYLFNLSFKTGIVPTSLKTAKCVPIYKLGKRQDFSNYRPISLLSTFANDTLSK